MGKHFELVVRWPCPWATGPESCWVANGTFLMGVPLTHLTWKQEPRSLLVHSVQVGGAPSDSIRQFLERRPGQLHFARVTPGDEKSVYGSGGIDCGLCSTRLSIHCNPAGCLLCSTDPAITIGFQSHSDLVSTRE